MKFFLGFDNEIMEKIKYQVFEITLEGFNISEEIVDSMGVFLGVHNQITVNLKSGAIIEIPDVYFDGIWGIQQCNPPELHSGEMHCRKLLSPKEPL